MKERILDSKSCWYDADLHISVNDFTKKEPPLDQISHGIILKKLFELIPNKYKTVLDVGCGNAKAHTLIGDRVYTGLDLPNNIKTIGKVNFKHLPFIACDILTDDLSFIKEYNIILLNGLIDVMHYPLLALKCILMYSKKYIILHRQEVINSKSYISRNPSYTGFTHHSLINRKALLSLLDKYNFEILHETDAGFGGNWRSFLLCKK